jgi:uncharacterized RmlC-like cupin family protein
MANNLITPSWITKTTLAHLVNNSAFVGNVNTDYVDQFRMAGAKAGTSIQVRKPVQGTIRDGAAANIQDINEPTFTITMENEFGIDWQFTDFDLAMKVDRFEERYLQPLGSRLAAELDLRIAQRMYKAVSNFVGTPGTSPATADVGLAANEKLDNQACPRGDRRVFALTPKANRTLVNGLSGFFNSQGVLDKQYRSGLLQNSLGFDAVMSQNMPSHTVGGLGGTPLVNGASQGLTNSGSTDNPRADTTSLVTDGWTAAAANRLRAGDVFTIAGVFAVQPLTKQVLPDLQQFVVTADVSSDGAGNATVVISPAIIAGGAYQNVSARPADNAAITVLTGTASTAYAQNLLFHRDAFSLVTIPMEVPGGMDMASVADHDGVAIRFVRGFDISNNKRICRFDLLAGYGAGRPEWAARVTS